MHRRVIQALREFTGDVEELERLQTFVRLKAKGKPNIGKLFEFF